MQEPSEMAEGQEEVGEEEGEEDVMVPIFYRRKIWSGVRRESFLCFLAICRALRTSNI